MKKKYTIDDCHKYAKDRGGICLSNEYHTIVEFKCANKEHKSWKASLSSLLRVKKIHDKYGWCNQCFIETMRYTILDCQESAIKNGGRCLSNDYVGIHSVYFWECKNKHLWKATFGSILNGKTWCPFCAKNIKLTLEQCKKYAISKGGRCLSTKYLNTKTLMLWQCSKNHQPWLATFYNIKKSNGTWCPYCISHITKPQIEIFEYLKIQFPILNIILNDTQIIKPFHLDIYIPSLKIGIEYDGEYWHYSDWAIEGGSFDRMKNKESACISKNIKLIRIREKDYIGDTKRVLMYLSNLIKKDNNENNFG